MMYDSDDGSRVMTPVAAHVVVERAHMPEDLRKPLSHTQRAERKQLRKDQKRMRRRLGELPDRAGPDGVPYRVRAQWDAVDKQMEVKVRCSLVIVPACLSPASIVWYRRSARCSGRR